MVVWAFRAILLYFRKYILLEYGVFRVILFNKIFLANVWAFSVIKNWKLYRLSVNLLILQLIFQILRFYSFWLKYVNHKTLTNVELVLKGKTQYG